METQEGKEILRRWYEEVVNKGDLGLIDALISEDYVGHTPLSPDVRGKEGVRQFVLMMRSAFPDVCVTIEDSFSEGNKVASHVRMVGTHQGEFAGLAPTGKVVNVTGMNITVVEDGKCIENWQQMDMLGSMKQLGGPV